MKILSLFKCGLIFWGGLAFFPLAAWAGEEMPLPDSYLPSTDEIMKQKASYDDKTDLFETFHPKKIMPAEGWRWMHFDVEKMKKYTAEILGFTGPELVAG